MFKETGELSSAPENLPVVDEGGEVFDVVDELERIKHSKEINPVLSEPMKLGEKQRPPRKDLKDFSFKNKFA